MLEPQRHLFDIPRDVAYINCAYLSPLMHGVMEAGQWGLTRKQHPWTVSRGDFYSDVEEARRLFAALVNAAPDDIAITASTSYGIAVAGANLPLARGQTVVVLEGQHASNAYQWIVRCRDAGAELVSVPRPEAGGWTAPVLAAIEARTAIVAVPNVHWNDGLSLDLVEIGAAARAVGAALVVDGTQSVGARPLDVREVKPDFLACAAYKWLMGPYSMGFLYVAPHRQHGVPLEQHSFNREGAEFGGTGKGYPETFQAGARRYDVGQRSNFIQLPMANAAMRQLLEWGVANVGATLAPLTRLIESRAKALGLETPSQGAGAAHMTGIRFPGGVPEGLEARLAERNVFISVRGPCMRISPHVYNDEEDVDRLFTALAPLL